MERYADRLDEAATNDDATNCGQMTTGVDDEEK
jgi:hypothetical protein